MIPAERIAAMTSELLPEAETFLCDLIRFPSTSSHETEAMEFLGRECGMPNVRVETVDLSDSLLSDPDYCSPIPGLKYDGRFNLRLVRKGTGGGRTLLLNTHVDVVPPSNDMAEPWTPRVEDGRVFGRGACDAKGQIATVFLVLRTLDALGVELRGDVVAHLVVEEENGGNGTLAMVRGGEKADACIVVEPSECRVLTSIRGAVWFKLRLTGKAGHSGAAGETRSALLMAREAMGILEAYHDRLLEESRNLPLYDVYPNPMPLTFGRLHAGDWPAMAPSLAVLEGVLGFLPNKTRDQVCSEMRRALIGGDDFLAENVDLSFTYRHDCSVVDPGHELPQGILRAAREMGVSSEAGAATSSSDAWLYSNQLGIPAVHFGPGLLQVCHARSEHIDMADIGKAAGVLTAFILDYCGM